MIMAAQTKAVTDAINAYRKMASKPTPEEKQASAEDLYRGQGVLGRAAKCHGNKVKCEAIASKTFPDINKKSQKCVLLSGLLVCNDMDAIVDMVISVRADLKTDKQKVPGFTACAKRVVTQAKEHGQVDLRSRVDDLYYDDADKVAKTKAQAASPAGLMDAVDAAVEKLGTVYTFDSLRGFKAALIVAAGDLVALPQEGSATTPTVVEPVAAPAADPMAAIKAMQAQLAAMLETV
jgi:hypothetical protein